MNTLKLLSRIKSTPKQVSSIRSHKMNPRSWFSALALSCYFLTSWSQACGLRDNGATYIDPGTGLEIQKCAIGQTWTGSQCTGKGTEYTFDQAVARHGRGEWRLITKDEAENSVKRFLLCNFYGGLWTWTSSPHVSKNLEAWYFAFSSGTVGYNARGILGEVRLVHASR